MVYRTNLQIYVWRPTPHPSGMFPDEDHHQLLYLAAVAMFEGLGEISPRYLWRGIPVGYSLWGQIHASMRRTGVRR
jgi:hypothetical protein